MQSSPSYTKPTHALAALVIGRVAMLGVWALPPSPISQWLLWGCLGLDAVVLLWQIGVIRLAIRSAGASAWSYLLGVFAIIAIAMVGTNGLNQLSNAWIEPPPPQQPQAALRMEGDTAFVEGVLDFDTYEALKATLLLDPAPTILSLTSEGGRIGAARGLARLVHEASLATHVPHLCASACTLVFAAGHTRTKGTTARIGFHGYRLLSDIATLNADEEAAKDIQKLMGYGVAEPFLVKAFAVPHDQMWFPSEAELRNGGLLTN